MSQDVDRFRRQLSIVQSCVQSCETRLSTLRRLSDTDGFARGHEGLLCDARNALKWAETDWRELGEEGAVLRTLFDVMTDLFDADKE